MRQRGFTLLELLVVIVLLSVATAIALPRFSAVLPGAELRSTGKRLANDLRYLYAYAVARREYVRLAIDLNAGEYWAETYTLRDDGADTGRVLSLQLRTDFSLAAESRHTDVAESAELRNAMIGRRTLPAGVRISEVELGGRYREQYGTVYIEFSPWGYGDDAAIVLVRGEARRVLRLNGLLGEAYLEGTDA